MFLGIAVPNDVVLAIASFVANGSEGKAVPGDGIPVHDTNPPLVRMTAKSKPNISISFFGDLKLIDSVSLSTVGQVVFPVTTLLGILVGDNSWVYVDLSVAMNGLDVHNGSFYVV